MEKRKVIGFGKSSYIVSLPKEWEKENKIKKGDELGFENKGQILIINSGLQETISNKEIIIDCESKDIQLIKRLIYSAYIPH